MDKGTLPFIAGIITAVAIGFAIAYIFTPKPQPSIELQVKYAKIMEHARITDSLLNIAEEKSEQDSIALEEAKKHLRELEADTIKIKANNAKNHATVRALPPLGQDSMLRSRLPAENPYK